MEDGEFAAEPTSKKRRLTDSTNENRDENYQNSFEDIISNNPTGKEQDPFENQQNISNGSYHVGMPRPIPAEEVEEDKLLPESSDKVTISRICERDVGITEYINSYSGIRGILKQRYADFVVREKDVNGKLVNLNEESIEEFVTDASCSKTEEVADEEKEKTNDCPLTENDTQEIEKFLSLVENPPEGEEKNKSVLLAPDNDKGHRTLVHKFVKKRYEMLDTETAQMENGDKAVKIFMKSKSNKRRRNGPETKKFCHFVLYKENLDTMNAVNRIADVLRLRSSSFSYAGTKDKRAVTVQKICACRVAAEKLKSVNNRIRNLHVGSFSYKDSPLKLGDLTGNNFSVVLRNIPKDVKEADVLSVMQSLKDVGFINYFGMQRFGSGSVPTFEIGKAVLQSDWKKTINLIMMPREGEYEAVFKAKKHWLESGDSREALKLLGYQRSIESQILAGLAKSGENAFYNAFQNLPRNTRMLYLHSYQSYVWNQTVSWRIREYGLKVLAGDLVVVNEQKSSDGDESGQRSSLTRCEVKHITQEDVDQKTYSINDVVMPLPGYDMTLPENTLKEAYNNIMESDGFTIRDMKHKIKDYSLSGAYRYVIVKPDDVTWCLVNYNDFCVPLIQTDLDVIEGREPPDLAADGEFKALKVEFTLPPSSYATMVIREITKLDSSAHQQSNFNKH